MVLYFKIDVWQFKTGQSVKTTPRGSTSLKYIGKNNARVQKYGLKHSWKTSVRVFSPQAQAKDYQGTRNTRQIISLTPKMQYCGWRTSRPSATVRD